MSTRWIAAVAAAMLFSCGQQAFSQNSLLRCGALFGRSGVALGPSIECETDPLSWLGAYLVVGKSQVDGYETRGIVAGAKDSSAGLGIVARPWRFGRFRLGGFVQATYTGDRTSASFPDGYGGMGHYFSSENGPLVTAGPDVQYRLAEGLWLVVRVGRNWGDGLAAHTVGGFSANAGVLVDPLRAGKRIRRLF